jgi:hypothetical protein
MSDSTTRTFRCGMALSLVLFAFGVLAQPAHAQRPGDEIVTPQPPKAPPPPPPIDQGDVACGERAEYQIVWGAGWTGKLVLRVPLPPYFIPTGVIESGASVYNLFWSGVLDPQDYIEGEQGPGYRGTDSTIGHRIVFWVDFNHTPGNILDDQRFDGYMMTGTKDAMAGVTWSRDVPYGFYATDKVCFEIQQ